MASDGKIARARWTVEPKDLPWDWMGNEYAWPPLNKPHQIQVLTNLRWGLATYILGDLELWEITQEVFCDLEVLDLDNLEDIRPRGHFAFNDAALYAMLGIEPISIKDWNAVIRFFSRTWFRRIWMVQEVALSQRLHFVCGREDIGWIELAGFAKWIHTLGWDVELKHQMLRKGIGSDMSGTELFLLVLEVASWADEGVDGEETRELLRSFFGVEDVEIDGVSILGILALRNQHRDATEPRDKIYGLLGLAKKFRGEYTWEYPTVDYSKSVEQIFQEFGEFLLHHSKSLAILSLVGPSRDDELRNLPSWIPNFRTTRSLEPLIVHKCHNSSRGWECTPRKPPSIRFIGFFILDLYQQGLRVILTDSMSKLSNSTL